MLNLMKYMRLSLPEDIAKLKYAGDFSRAEKLIEQKLSDPLVPDLMKNRLLLEKEILSRLPGEYPYTQQEALALIQKEIPDFTMDELNEWMDRGDADWFMVNGERHLQERFFASMKKVYPEIAQRAHEESASSQLLDENIQAMKENGGAAWKIRLRHTLRIKDESFEKGKVLVHLPVPAPCLNMKAITILHTDPENAITAEADSESRTVSFEAELSENRTFSVEYEYLSEVRYNNPDPALAVMEKTYDFREEEPELVSTPLIKALAEQLAAEETNPLLIARHFYPKAKRTPSIGAVGYYRMGGDEFAS